MVHKVPYSLWTGAMEVTGHSFPTSFPSYCQDCWTSPDPVSYLHADSRTLRLWPNCFIRVSHVFTLKINMFLGHKRRRRAGELCLRSVWRFTWNQDSWIIDSDIGCAGVECGYRQRCLRNVLTDLNVDCLTTTPGDTKHVLRQWQNRIPFLPSAPF